MTNALTPYQFTIDAAIAEWLHQKETRTGSQKTRKAYADTMSQFRAALASVSLDMLDTPVDVARLAGLWASTRVVGSRRAGQDVSPGTYNQRLAILSSFYTFLQETYHLDTPTRSTARRARGCAIMRLLRLHSLPGGVLTNW